MLKILIALVLLTVAFADAALTGIEITYPAHGATVSPGIPLDVRFEVYANAPGYVQWVAVDRNRTLAQNYGGMLMEQPKPYPGASGETIQSGFRWTPAAGNHTLAVFCSASDGSTSVRKINLSTVLVVN